MQTTWSKLRSKSTTFHNESKHFYNKIGFFDFFPYFSNAGGPPKIWKVQLFKTFWQEMSKVASMGPGKYQREQSHAFGKLSSNNEVAAGGFLKMIFSYE